jgi:hypothetical protein
VAEGTGTELASEAKGAKKQLTPEERIALDRSRLIQAVESNSLESINDRVGFILNNFPKTRNSDKSLCIKYWELYQRDQYSPTIAEHIFDLEHVPSIVRARAKVQNTFGLFQGTEKARQRRYEREEELREAEATAVVPPAKIPIYADESGKTEKYLLVGGAWFLDAGLYFDAWMALKEFCKCNEVPPDKELKFSTLTRQTSDLAMGFVKEFLKYQRALSLKVTVLERAALRRPIETAVYDLYRHFIILGLEHEIKCGRIELPRVIDVVKDKDDGSDSIALRDLEIKLRENLKQVFDKKVTLESLTAKNSTADRVLQAVDLIVGSVNRLLNNQAGNSNHKDDFAKELVAFIGLDPANPLVSGAYDWVQIEEISKQEVVEAVTE